MESEVIKIQNIGRFKQGLCAWSHKGEVWSPTTPLSRTITNKVDLHTFFIFPMLKYTFLLKMGPFHIYYFENYFHLNSFPVISRVNNTISFFVNLFLMQNQQMLLLKISEYNIKCKSISPHLLYLSLTPWGNLKIFFLIFLSRSFLCVRTHIHTHTHTNSIE